MSQERKRVPISKVANDIKEVKEILLNVSPQVIQCGSIRRGVTETKDCDLIVVTNETQVVNSVIKRYVDTVTNARIEMMGSKKCTFMLPCSDIEMGFQFDIVYADLWNVGAMMLYLTGDASFNIATRQQAKLLGFTLNQYGIFDVSKRKLAGATEKEMFHVLRCPWMHPKERTARLFLKMINVFKDDESFV